MTTVHDVAAYILRKLGPMSAMKLQKLAYYAQAWHLVWVGEPMFPEKIQAWANGPVVYELFDLHRGRFTVGPAWPSGDVGNLDAAQRGTLDAVLADYGKLSGRQLSHLAHAEDPWRDARRGLGSTEASQTVIPEDEIARYYDAVDTDEAAMRVDQIDWRAWEESS